MKIFEKMKRIAKPAGVLLLATILFAACQKDDFNNGNIRTPAAGFMAFNLASDQNAAGFSLSGNNLSNAALNYTSYTGNYLPIYTGAREVRSYDFNTGSTLAITNATFADSSYYSAFLIGKSGSYRNVIVQDQLDSLNVSAGKAWVRYINAIADSAAVPSVSIGTSGETTINEQSNYANVSAYKAVNAGPVNTAVVSGSDFSASRTITLEENKVYTVLFVGDPTATDSTRNVQIKFIQNGTVTP
jgi:Domain of unknown function (DUF4397)